MRGIVLTPYLVSNVVTALLWLLLLDYQLGIVNELLEWVGIGRQSLLGQPDLVVPTIAMVNVWRHVGYTALLIFAGLQTISPQVYEAAKVDGASEWSMFWRITLPLLRPYLAMVLIVTSIGSFQVFDTVSVATQGGPGERLERHPVLHLQRRVRPLRLRLRVGDVGRTARGAVRHHRRAVPTVPRRRQRHELRCAP